jgi:putative effector of murein hydrolase
MRIRDAVVRGFVFGTAAHAIGTAQAFREGEATGAFAALGMGFTGVATALLVPVLVLLLRVQSWTFAAH